MTLSKRPILSEIIAKYIQNAVKSTFKLHLPFLKKKSVGCVKNQLETEKCRKDTKVVQISKVFIFKLIFHMMEKKIKT